MKIQFDFKEWLTKRLLTLKYGYYLEEFCAECSELNYIGSEPAPCTSCGERVLPCSLCDWDNVSCDECKYEEAK